MELSVCMITKDEDKVLKRCLQSLQPLAADVVVVDTGINESTKNVVIENGGRYFTFKWCDDFSKARNYSIKQAKYDDVLIIDSDEWLATEETERNKEIFKAFIRYDASTLGCCYQASIRPEITYSKFKAVVPRLFSRKYYTFTGRVHEQPVLLDKAGESRTIIINLNLYHDGYVSITSKRKAKRNLDLLLKDLADQPKNPYVLFQTGESYLILNKYQQALEYLQQALKQPEFGYKSAYAYETVTSYLNVLYHLKKSELVKKEILRFAPKFANVADFWYDVGVIYINLTEVDAAIAAFKHATQCTTVSAPGKESDFSYYSLGQIYTQLGDYQQAIAYYKKCKEKFEPAQVELEKVEYTVAKKAIELEEKPEKQIELAQRFLNKYPKTTYMYYISGQAYLKLADKAQASVSFLQVIKNTTKTDVKSFEYLAAESYLALMIELKQTITIDFVKKYAFIWQTADSMFLLASYYIQIGQYQQAKVYLKQAKNFISARIEGRNTYLADYYLGTLCENAGQEQQALKYYQAAFPFKFAIKAAKKIKYKQLDLEICIIAEKDTQELVKVTLDSLKEMQVDKVVVTNAKQFADIVNLAVSYQTGSIDNLINYGLKHAKHKYILFLYAGETLYNWNKENLQELLTNSRTTTLNGNIFLVQTIQLPEMNLENRRHDSRLLQVDAYEFKNGKFICKNSNENELEIPLTINSSSEPSIVWEKQSIQQANYLFYQGQYFAAFELYQQLFTNSEIDYGIEETLIGTTNMIWAAIYSRKTTEMDKLVTTWIPMYSQFSLFETALGDYYLAQAELGAAKDAYQQALNLHNSLSKCYNLELPQFGLGKVYEQLNEKTIAKTHYLAASSLPIAQAALNNLDLHKYLCIDIGGQSLKYGLFDELGRKLLYNTIPTPTISDLMLALMKIIEQQKEKLCGVGISILGNVDTSSGQVYLLRQQKSLNLQKVLQNLEIPVAIENDGRSAAIGEKNYGLLKNVKNAAVLVLGSALAGALIINGQLFTGSNNKAAELSYLMQDSQRVMYQTSAVELINSLSQKLALDKADYKVVFTALNKHDERIWSIFEEYCYQVAKVIYNLQITLDLDTIVIAGAISQQPLLIQTINRQYDILNQAITLKKPQILAASLKSDANLYGALKIISDKERENNDWSR